MNKNYYKLLNQQEIHLFHEAREYSDRPIPIEVIFTQTMAGFEILIHLILNFQFVSMVSFFELTVCLIDISFAVFVGLSCVKTYEDPLKQKRMNKIAGERL